MERSRKSPLAVGIFQHRVLNSIIAIVFSMMLLLFPFQVAAQEECSTVKDCAQDMVTIANELKAENAALILRIEALEAALAKQASDTATALENRIARLKAGSDSNSFPGGNGVSGICPAGTYMVGARWQSDGGGPHGIISWFGPVCRSMP